MLTHTVSDRASVAAAAAAAAQTNTTNNQKENPTVHQGSVFQNIHIYTYRAGISGREFRALASGTQTSSLVRVVKIKGRILPVRTFVWSIYNRLVCVALQPAVPIDEVHQVLRCGDGGYIDGEALQGEKMG